MLAKDGGEKEGGAAANPPPVARMPHASLPPPKKGPHHDTAQQGAPPPSLVPPGFNYVGNFGFPMQGTIASTPADAPAMVSTPQINQLLAVQQQQQRGLGVLDTTMSLVRQGSAKMPRKRGAPSVQDALLANGPNKRQRRSTKKRGKPSTNSGRGGAVVAEEDVEDQKVLLPVEHLGE